MIFKETSLPGAFLLALEKMEDERGFFARTYCAEEFSKRGLNAMVAQSSISLSRQRGTLRGMHFQAAPQEEAKLVRCIGGAIYDVVLDLRPRSPAFRDHFGVELTAENRWAVYVPEGCAHGFVTLKDNTEVFYQMSRPHAPELARGVRWNDLAFGIKWPITQPILNPRDSHWPDFKAPLS
jgi:dTDP-4-dehydrorhamnose 3,5-epimerase